MYYLGIKRRIDIEIKKSGMFQLFQALEVLIFHFSRTNNIFIDYHIKFEKGTY